jgi:hypothetical protein
MKPTGRANARPDERNSARAEMTGSAQSGNLNRGPRISLALDTGYKIWIIKFVEVG